MDDLKSNDANRDPITGSPGAHPVGTGIGAAVGGAAAGAATGTMAGPVGTVIGAAVGAVVGGLAGKGIAEKIDPTREDAYWRDNWADRPYVDREYDYADYGPAYGLGVDAYGRYPDKHFDEIEPELSHDWGTYRGSSRLEWERARSASLDAWERLRARGDSGPR